MYTSGILMDTRVIPHSKHLVLTTTHKLWNVNYSYKYKMNANTNVWFKITNNSKTRLSSSCSHWHESIIQCTHSYTQLNCTVSSVVSNEWISGCLSTTHKRLLQLNAVFFVFSQFDLPTHNVNGLLCIVSLELFKPNDWIVRYILCDCTAISFA